MCTKSFILILVFLLKILVFLIPISMFILKKIGFIEKVINTLFLVEVLFLIILLTLCIFGTDCINYSTISGIKLNYNLFGKTDYLDEENINIDYNNINPSKVYKNNVGLDVNYYNINLYPFKNIKILCNKKSYFQNYGNDIAAVATGISTITRDKTNPYKILTLLEKTELISCEKIPSIEDIFSTVSTYYKVNFRLVSIDELYNIINSGKVVIGKTKVTDNNFNISCGENLIVIYSSNNKNEFNILNPSDRINDTFCPNNTLGYGSIIKGNQNNSSYSIDELSNYISEFYVVEVK